MGVTLTDVRIGGKRVLDRSIVENHAFAGAHDVLKHGVRELARRDWHSSQGYVDLALSSACFRFNLMVVAAEENQQASLSTSVLDRNSHQ
jgi:hypothetical protein